MIPQEFISVLSYYAKLRDIDFTAEKGTLWKIYGISNTWPAFIDTDSYWGSFSQVQSIFILCLSKHLLQVTEVDWESFSKLPAPTYHLGYIKRLALAVPRVWGEPQMPHLTWEPELSCSTKLRRCVMLLFSALQTMPIAPKPETMQGKSSGLPADTSAVFILHSFCLIST